MSAELTCSSLYIAFMSNHPVLGARDGTEHCFPFVYLCAFETGSPCLLFILNLKSDSAKCRDYRLPSQAHVPVSCGVSSDFWDLYCVTVMKLQMDGSLPECRKHNFQSVTITNPNKPPFCYVILILFTDTALLKKKKVAILALTVPIWW